MFDLPLESCIISNYIRAVSRGGSFLTASIVGFLMLCTLSQCNNPRKKTHPVIWKKSEYSKLFKLGIAGQDTFLLLLKPADTNETIGAYHWGKTSFIEGYTFLKNRSKAIVLSAVFVGMIDALALENLLIGVDNTQFISSPRTIKRIQSNLIQSYAALGSPQQEKIAASDADLIIAYFIDEGDKRKLDKLRNTEKKVLYFQNFLEMHPLGRAEWVKVFGYLFGKAKQADNMFEEIKTHYEELASQNRQFTYKPNVLCNAPYSGIWDIPTGESYMAKLISDAGGYYPWAKENGTGRIPLSIENVYATAHDADIWINPGACEKMQCLSGIDKRLLTFKPVKNQSVYNCTKLLKENGSNAYWEYGVLRPDLALRDLSALFHPDAYQDHVSIFYESLSYD